MPRTPTLPSILQAIQTKYLDAWFKRNTHEAYAFWLAGYIANGGAVTCLGKPHPITLLSDNNVIKPAHGSRANTFLIQPKQSISVEPFHSHNTIYDMNTFTAYRQGTSLIPVDAVGITPGIRDQIQMYSVCRTAVETTGLSLNALVEKLRHNEAQAQANYERRNEIAVIRNCRNWDIDDSHTLVKR